LSGPPPGPGFRRDRSFESSSSRPRQTDRSSPSCAWPVACEEQWISRRARSSPDRERHRGRRFSRSLRQPQRPISRMGDRGRRENQRAAAHLRGGLGGDRLPLAGFGLSPGHAPRRLGDSRVRLPRSSVAAGRARQTLRGSASRLGGSLSHQDERAASATWRDHGRPRGLPRLSSKQARGHPADLPAIGIVSGLSLTHLITARGPLRLTAR
jgi:hypothetical protein